MGTTEDRNIELAREFLALITTDGAGAVEKFLADDGKYVILGTLPISGSHAKPVIKEMLRGVLDAFSVAPVITVIGATAQGNRVAIEARSAGTLQDGREYRNAYHFLFEAGDDGQFRTIKEYADTLTAHQLFFAAPAG